MISPQAYLKLVELGHNARWGAVTFKFERQSVEIELFANQYTVSAFSGCQLRGMMHVMSLRTKRLLKSALTIALTVAAIYAVGVVLYLNVWIPYSDNYVLTHADPVMIKLADEAGMSRKGKLVFLRTSPQFVSDTEMQTVCAENTAANNSNGFIEQGCYSPSDNRIYLREMPADLHELEVSTASYEMLHPVYISLRESREGDALDAAIEANYLAINDAHLNEQVANFAKTEPEARDLELFSLLGTNYTNLSASLSRYYAPYFDDISKTVAANNAVTKLFNDSQAELDQLKAQIDQCDTRANNAYAASVRWANAGSQYWDDYYYDLYTHYIDQENTAIDRYNTLIVSYNALVTEYNGTQPVKQINPAQTQSE